MTIYCKYIYIYQNKYVLYKQIILLYITYIL